MFGFINVVKRHSWWHTGAMRTLTNFFLTAAIGTFLVLGTSAMAGQPAKTDKKATASTDKKAATATAAAPTAQEIADAKTKGMVWVNTSTKVYHKEGQYYGNTKHGKFMTEADAQKAGYKAAKEPTPKKAATADPKKK